MIVVEESDVRKSRLNHESNGAVATPNTPLIPAESPPAYTLRDGPGPSSSSTHPSYTPQSSPVTQKRRPKPAATRFFEALLLALGACAVIVFVVKLLTHIINGPPHDFPEMVGYPSAQDGRIIRCVRGGEDGWSPDSRLQFLSFDVPLNSSAIYIFTRGRQATGRVTVVPQEANASDKITVDVASQDHEWDAFRSTTVCQMEREKGEQGVGIFTPAHLTWSNRRTEVEVTVKIPHQSATSVLELLGFEILAPDFQVTLPNADNFVNFQNLTIHTSNMQVVVGSVKATNIDIQTSNAGVRGTFITDSSLSLATSNAPITANIFLENDSASGKKTSVHVDTTGGSLTGTISLLSNQGSPGYTVRAATTNAGLSLAFLQPSDSSHPSPLPILDIVGSTTNGPAELLLQSSFEGAFDISTSPTFQAGLSSMSTSDSDPLGLGRQHHIDFMLRKNSRKEGHVYWGDLDDGRELGRVELSTSNGPASLHIQ